MFFKHAKSKGAIWEPFGRSKFLGASKTRTALEEYAFSMQAKILHSAGLESLKSGCRRNTHGAQEIRAFYSHPDFSNAAKARVFPRHRAYS